MTSCHHRSGYLGDDEAGHTTGHNKYMARVQSPKKPQSQETGQTNSADHLPHPPSTSGPPDNSGHRSHNHNQKGLQHFGSFLDFLVEGQVLDSLQTVVEKATKRMATLKTEAGVPLVDVQDPAEEQKGKRRVRSRHRKTAMHRHRGHPGLCIGRSNNYPSCSSSDSHCSSKTDHLNSHNRDSKPGARGLGSLPPIKDRLLLENNLKRLLHLENKGKKMGLSRSRGDYLLWDSLDSQWSLEHHPFSCFTGMNGSRENTLDATKLGSRGRNPILRELDKEIRSLMNKQLPLDLRGYCCLQEPQRTLDFLVEHQLFPVLQDVVNQAVEKLCRARRHDGQPLFPTIEQEDSNLFCMPHVRLGTSADNLKAARPPISHQKTTMPRWGRPKKADSSDLYPQLDPKLRFKAVPTKELNFSSYPGQPPLDLRSPMSEYELLSAQDRAHPHKPQNITLPSPSSLEEMDSPRVHFTEPAPTFPLSPSYHQLPHQHYHRCQHLHHHHHHHHTHSPSNLLYCSSSCAQLNWKMSSSGCLESLGLGLPRKNSSGLCS